MKKHYYKDDIKTVCKDRHLTVEEIFSEISKTYNWVWKSSIYRNVEEMVKNWDLKKVVWIDSKAYFEANIWEHIHLINVETGEIFDLPEKIKISNLPENFEVSGLDVKVFWNFK
jgi:Fe2+ or Zn2+ uptake regulation protein